VRTHGPSVGQSSTAAGAAASATGRRGSTPSVMVTPRSDREFSRRKPSFIAASTSVSICRRVTPRSRCLFSASHEGERFGRVGRTLSTSAYSRRRFMPLFALLIRPRLRRRRVLRAHLYFVGALKHGAVRRADTRENERALPPRARGRLAVVKFEEFFRREPVAVPPSDGCVCRKQRERVSCVPDERAAATSGLDGRVSITTRCLGRVMRHDDRGAGAGGDSPKRRLKRGEARVVLVVHQIKPRVVHQPASLTTPRTRLETLGASGGAGGVGGCPHMRAAGVRERGAW
jgi:hypothetical protein